MTEYRTDREMFPDLYAVKHAPVGGVTIGGTFFRGGEFIPEQAMARATSQERDALRDAVKSGRPRRKAVSRSAVRYFQGHPPELTGTGERGQVSLHDVASHLAGVNAARGRILPGDEAGLEELGQTLAEEAAYAVAQDNSAVGWYDAKVRAAMELVSQLHPELRSDPNRMALYKAMVAITSNGQDVRSNFFAADDLYEHFKKTGKVRTDGSFGGQTSGTINSSLQDLQDLIEQLGLVGARAFLARDMTARELGQAGYPVSGELADTPLKGSMIFGPKIGSFYNNLQGDFSTVTMDRWFMRTINRLTGTLVDVSPEALKKQAQRILDVLEEGGKGLELHGHRKAELVAEAKRLATTGDHTSVVGKLADWAGKQHAVYARSGFRDKSEANLAAKQFNENLSGLNEYPSGGRERAWIRRAVGRAQEILAARGIKLTNADFQAGLWYLEKRLYARLGMATSRQAPADYEMAARELLNAKRPAGEPGDTGRGVGPGGAGRVGSSYGREDSAGAARDAVPPDWGKQAARGDATFSEPCRLHVRVPPEQYASTAEQLGRTAIRCSPHPPPCFRSVRSHLVMPDDRPFFVDERLIDVPGIDRIATKAVRSFNLAWMRLPQDVQALLSLRHEGRQAAGEHVLLYQRIEVDGSPLAAGYSPTTGNYCFTVEGVLALGDETLQDCALYNFVQGYLHVCCLHLCEEDDAVNALVRRWGGNPERLVEQLRRWTEQDRSSRLDSVEFR